MLEEILLVDRQGVPVLSIKPISSVVQKDAPCLLYIFKLEDIGAETSPSDEDF